MYVVLQKRSQDYFSIENFSSTMCQEIAIFQVVALQNKKGLQTENSLLVGWDVLFMV